MSYRKLFVSAVVAMISLGMASQAFAQQGGGAGGGRGGRGGAGGNFDPAAMQKTMLDRIKTELGATDEEWTIISPKLEKVMTLQRDLRGVMGMGMPGGRGGRGGRGGADSTPAADGVAPQMTPPPPTDLSESAKKLADLQKVLQTTDAKPEDIKAALTALRDARNKVKAELATAQKDLIGVLKAKQEAQLVAQGMLD